MELEKLLQSVKWKEFKVEDIAKIDSGKDINDDEKQEGSLPYIGASSVMNGITHFISNQSALIDKGILSVARTGSVGTIFFHPYKACFSNNVRRININTENKYINLFIKTALEKQKVKFKYGYIMGTERIRRQIIKLPVTSDGKPDWSFMEQFMKKVEKEVNPEFDFCTYEILDNRELNGLEWNIIEIESIFDIERGQRLTKKEQKKGSTPYISSSAINNGLDNFINPPTKMKKHSNCITIANSGSVGIAFFHPYEFVASDHVTVLKNSKLNKFNSLFLTAILSRLREKYSYNREINNERLKREKLILPVKNKEPDWAFMEEYVKKINNIINNNFECISDF